MTEVYGQYNISSYVFQFIPFFGKIHLCTAFIFFHEKRTSEFKFNFQICFIHNYLCFQFVVGKF